MVHTFDFLGFTLYWSKDYDLNNELHGELDQLPLRQLLSSNRPLYEECLMEGMCHLQLIPHPSLADTLR